MKRSVTKRQNYSVISRRHRIVPVQTLPKQDENLAKIDALIKLIDRMLE